MERGRDQRDRLSWALWLAGLRSFARSDMGGRGKLLFGALLMLLLLISGLNVLNSYVGRDFMTAIAERSMPRFVSMAMLYLAVFVASTVVAGIYRFSEERLALLCREWLTRRLVGRYLANDVYYWVREHTEVANPDQRIADDARAFTATTISLTLIGLNSTFTILAFSGVMWSISPLLFGVAVAYAALGSGLTVLFGRPLIWLNYNQADREAGLRAELVHLREHAESFAVLRQEGRFRARVMRRIDELVENMKLVIMVNRNLGFFTAGYNYLIQIIPVLIVAPLFIRGQVEFGVISQSAVAFSQLLGAFSLVITQFQQISSYAVVVTRLNALGESITEVEPSDASGIKLRDDVSQLSWQSLSLRSHDDERLLLRSLTYSVVSGVPLLVTGANEAARIALFRATAGLWRRGEGWIERPPRGSIQFVTERPHLPPGTLREALMDAQRDAEDDAKRISMALRAVGIEDVVTRAGGLDVERDWDELLSLAEQQRLAFARVLLSAPRFAVLDRPGTLLGADAADILDLLAKHSITGVTFAPDGPLAAAHDVRLVLEADGTWQTQRIRRERGAG